MRVSIFHIILGPRDHALVCQSKTEIPTFVVISTGQVTERVLEQVVFKYIFHLRNSKEKMFNLNIFYIFMYIQIKTIIFLNYLLINDNYLSDNLKG